MSSFVCCCHYCHCRCHTYSSTMYPFTKNNRTGYASACTISLYYHGCMHRAHTLTGNRQHVSLWPCSHFVCPVLSSHSMLLLSLCIKRIRVCERVYLWALTLFGDSSGCRVCLFKYHNRWRWSWADLLFPCNQHCICGHYNFKPCLASKSAE